MNIPLKMDDKVPVFIIHDGEQFYVKHSIIAAKETDHFTIHVNNNKNNLIFCDLHLSSDIISEKYDIFKKKYIHMSTNTYKFELSCFKRYFLLDHYSKICNINSFWLSDSDLLIVSNLKYLTQYIHQQSYLAALSWQPNDTTYNWAYSPHLSFWTNDAISSFTSFLIDFYDNIPSDVLDMWNYFAANQMSGGICDMTLLYLWAKNKLIYNLAKAHLDGFPLHDHNMNVPINYMNDQFKMNSIFKIKKITNDCSNIYFHEIISNTFYQAGSLHFQGRAKIFIEQFMLCKNTNTISMIPFCLRRNSFKFFINRVLSKFFV